MNMKMERSQELSRFIKEEGNLFAFVHAGADKALWHEIETANRHGYSNLLPDDKQDALGEITPYLVKLDFSDDFTQWLLGNDKLMQDAFFVGSSLETEDLAQRFKKLIFCSDEQGKHYYFGFYVAQNFIDYLMYLKSYEAAQCRGLCKDIDFFIFNKHFFTSERQREFGSDAFYLALYIRDHLDELTQDISPVLNYLPAKFFNFCSKQRVYRYKQFSCNCLCEKYPDSFYSQQEKKEMFKIMDEIIYFASNHRITNEDAVKDLFEASWLSNKNIFKCAWASSILSEKGCQKQRTSKLLEITQEYLNG